MNAGRDIDAVLVSWGDRLFYPGNRIVRADPPPRLQARAAAIRGRIGAVVRRAPQVIVRVTGGGKGMASIAAHFRYITRGGEIEFEDDRGTVRGGKEALHDLADQWRCGGTHIGNDGYRREALNLVLALRAGTDAELLRGAVRGFARSELAGHRYVMVLHRHQASPHVHLCVRMESASGTRLRPGLSGLKRWRETFAEQLRGVGIDADATWKSVRGATREFELPWEMKARDAGRLKKPAPGTCSTPGFAKRCAAAAATWGHIIHTLQDSDRADDRKLAVAAAEFVCRMPYIQDLMRRDPQALPAVRRHLEAQRQRGAPADPSRGPESARSLPADQRAQRSGPEWRR